MFLRRSNARLVSFILLAGTIAVGLANPAPAASLTLTPAGMAQGLSLTTFASGFPSADAGGGTFGGPLGIAFPTTGGVLVSDLPGNVRLFPNDLDGQNAASAPIGHNYGSANAVGLAQVGSNIYMTAQALGDLVQINNNGTFNQIILTGLSVPVGLIADPFNGHLFVGAAGSSLIYDVDPIAKTKTPFVSNLTADGLSLSPDGTTLYAKDVTGHIFGFNTTTKAQVFDSGFIPGGIDGIAVGTGLFSGLIFANTNGGTVVEVNLNTLAQTTIATGGSRGDFATVDPSTNTLLLTQTDSIVRLNGASFTIPEPSSLVLGGLALVLLACASHQLRRCAT
jgi:hypothetical protein